MSDDQEAVGAYAGRSFRDPDDGSGAACFAPCGGRLFEVEYEVVPDALVPRSYIEELCK